MIETIELTGIDPLVFGDGRPYGADRGAQSVGGQPLPYPSTLSGALRTAIAEHLGLPFTSETATRLRSFKIRGPFLLYRSDYTLPTPSNYVLMQVGESNQVFVSQPLELRADEGVDLPDGLLPCGLKDVPPAAMPTKDAGPHRLTLADTVQWLLGGRLHSSEIIPPVPIETRIHVGIRPETMTSAEGMLFHTAGSVLNDDFRLVAEISHDGTAPLFGEGGTLTLGGERRCSLTKPAAPIPKCPTEVQTSLSNAKRVALTLATPAIFSRGYRPAWTTPPGASSSLTLTLRSVVSPRRQAVSGWDLLTKAPKAARWLLPAGAVLFFDVDGGNPAELADLWLQPVSDGEADRNDGFGLGIWTPVRTL